MRHPHCGICCNAQFLSYIDLEAFEGFCSPIVVAADALGRRPQAPNSKDISMSATDPFATIPFQVPEHVRVLAEKGVAQAREGYQKFKEAAETSNVALEAVYTSATKGAGDFTSKVLDIARTNTESAFDFTQRLLGVKSVHEAFDIVNAHARKQFEVLTAQSKELADVAQKVATDTVEPIKAGAAKAFKSVA
jgi:phasin